MSKFQTTYKKVYSYIGYNEGYEINKDSFELEELGPEWELISAISVGLDYSDQTIVCFWKKTI